MFSLSPRFAFYASRNSLARALLAKLESGVLPCARRESAAVGRLSAIIRGASYWLGGANEMAAINTILIIVNSATR
jgi:hypothetical protein